MESPGDWQRWGGQECWTATPQGIYTTSGPDLWSQHSQGAGGREKKKKLHSQLKDEIALEQRREKVSEGVRGRRRNKEFGGNHQ